MYTVLLPDSLMRTVIAVLCSQSGLTIIVPRPSEPAGGKNLENKNVYIVYKFCGNESTTYIYGSPSNDIRQQTPRPLAQKQRTQKHSLQ